jgi:divalent metal cation (Fe/Co/Zn/Cd) transporter
MDGATRGPDLLRRLPSRPSIAASGNASASARTRVIVIALAANLVVAVAKLAAGMLTGSAALVAEAGHSFADSLNEVLLAVSLRRGNVPADAAHPLGHGRERFLWAFMAAIASFLIGGCLSIALGIQKLLDGGTEGNLLVGWVVLALQAVYTGPDQVIVAAKVRPVSALTIPELTHAMDEVDHAMRSSFPRVADVYVDVTAFRDEQT